METPAIYGCRSFLFILSHSVCHTIGYRTSSQKNPDNTYTLYYRDSLFQGSDIPPYSITESK